MFFENKKSYNGGSEWQNDYQNMPDYYQTYYRNYDPELGRFVGIDPKAETAESITTYQYAGNNPVMMNDPMGDLLQKLQPSPPPRDDSNTHNGVITGFRNSFTITPAATVVVGAVSTGVMWIYNNGGNLIRASAGE